jgi:excisionase family DNA binding protein
MKKQELFTREEAAIYLGVSPLTLKTWASIKPKELPYRRVGRYVQYRKEDLDRYIKMKEVGR